jgi:peptide/nickel transport system substrate-binding protein
MKHFVSTRPLRALSLGLAVATCLAWGGAAFAQSGPQNLRFAPGNFPVSLDIQTYPAEEGVQVVSQQIFQTLVSVRDGVATPLIAESWSNPDPLTWTFKIRDGVTFSDGSALTANDVKSSLDRLIGLGSSFAPLFVNFDATRADDDKTFTVTTKVPVGTMLNTLSLVFIGKGDGVGNEAYWQKPVGTGPFAVSDYVPDDHVTLVRNENYWGENKAKLDTLEVVSMPEVSSKITGLVTGELHVMTTVPPDQVNSVNGVDGVEYMTGPSYQYLVTWFNEQREPFDDVRVRQAMWHAIDVKQVVTDLYGPDALATSPIARAVFGAPDLEQLSYDPALAKKLLAEAGHPDGFSSTFIWPREAGPNIRSLAQAFISAWADVGIKVEPMEVERAKWLEDFIAVKYDITMFNNATATGDADFTLNRLYTCAAAAKRTGYCNEKLDATLLAAAASLNQDERRTLYGEAAATLWDDAVGIWPVEIPNTAAVRTEVKGFALSPNSRHDFSTVYLSN